MKGKERNTEIDKMLKGLEVPFKNTKEDSWASIQSKLSEKETPVFSLLEYPKRKFKLGIAASILLVASLSFFFIFNNSSKHYYSHCESELVLPDHTNAFLFKNSELSYEENEEFRFLKLSGGGIFKVKKGKPFLVETELGIIEVLGTVFSVDAQGRHLIVKCSEGSVKVSGESYSENIIAGQSLMASEQGVLISQIGKSELVNREFGALYFTETPLEEVIIQLQNEFDINIKTSIELNTYVYSGNFSNNNLEEALDLVCIPLGLQYEIKKSEVLFYK